MHVTIAISHAHPVWKENHVFNNLSDLLFKHCKEVTTKVGSSMMKTLNRNSNYFFEH